MGALSFPLSVLLSVLVGSTPDVRGRTSCPSAAEVSEHLGAMLSSEASFPRDGFVELADVPARAAGLLDIEVRLRNTADGQPLAVRRVERTGGCSETTDAVAVIAASWAGRYQTPAPAGPPDTVGVDSTAIARALPSRAPASTAVSIGALGGIVAATEGGAAPLLGAEVEARRGPWTVRLALAGIGERAVDLAAAAPGMASWRRLVAIPSLGLGSGSGRFFVEAAAGALLGLNQTRGRGLATNGSDVGFDVGLAPGLRIGARLTPASATATIWLGSTALIWLRPHGVSVAGATGASAAQTLPRLDGWLGGGVMFGFGS